MFQEITETFIKAQDIHLIYPETEIPVKAKYKHMHKSEIKIIEIFRNEKKKELSTSELIESIYSDELKKLKKNLNPFLMIKLKQIFINEKKHNYIEKPYITLIN